MGTEGPQRHRGKPEQTSGNKKGAGRGIHEEPECADIPVENKHGLHPAGNWLIKIFASRAEIIL